MTIKELVASKNYIGSSIKLGASEGTGYLFCGPIDSDFDKRIAEAEDYSRERTKDYINSELFRLEMHLEDFEHDWARQHKDRINKFYEKHGRNMTDEELKKFEKRFAASKKRDKAKTISEIDRFSHFQKEYSHLLDREIVDIYPSVDEANTAIIIFEGLEYGPYWTSEEYAKKRKSKGDRDIYSTIRGKFKRKAGS